MNLTQFITSASDSLKRLIAHVDKVEAQATTPAINVADLQATIEAANKTISERDATILELNGKIAALEASAKSAGEQAAKIVAAQCAEALPVPTQDTGSAKAGAGDLVAQLEAIPATNPAERVAFIQANYEALVKIARK